MDNDSAVARLEALWRAALNNPMHTPGCGCAIGGTIRIDAETLELDLIDYVEYKRELHRLPAWQDAVRRRSSDRTPGFARWFHSLGGEVLPPELHAIALADIEATLTSMTAHAAGRLVPVGALSGGWLGKASSPASDDSD